MTAITIHQVLLEESSPVPRDQWSRILSGDKRAMSELLVHEAADYVARVPVEVLTPSRQGANVWSPGTCWLVHRPLDPHNGDYYIDAPDGLYSIAPSTVAEFYEKA